MKIAEITQAKSVEVHEAENRKPAAAPKKRATGDVVELSAAVAGESTVRQEELKARRVAALKEQIEAGTYRADSRQVAEKMLSSSSGI